MTEEQQRRLEELKGNKQIEAFRKLVDTNSAAQRINDDKNTQAVLSELEGLSEALENQTKASVSSAEELAAKLEKLEELGELSKVSAKLDRLSELQEALIGKEFPASLEVSNFHQLANRFAQALDKVKIPDNSKALTALLKSMEKVLEVTTKQVSQSASDYVPYRRVINVQGRGLIFDDTPTPTESGRGGGGAASSSGGGSTDVSALALEATLLDVLAALQVKSGTATLSNVADTATSTTLLASNADRLGASVYNDSTVALYLKLGTTASATSFTIKLQPDDYYEVPAGYTGRIDGIWASDASGSARITELT